jgi:hypothetical protein
MNNFFLSQNDSKVAARMTPWDKKALGFNTAEITELGVFELDDGDWLLGATEDWCLGQSVRYLFGRIDASDRRCRTVLLARGYQFVETSLTISRSCFAKLPQIPSGMQPLLRPSVAADIPALRLIAANDFAHGRFLEDPAIELASAAERTANWIEDLVAGGLAYTAEMKGQIIGFHAEKVNPVSSSAELLLTGAASKYEVLALPLWVTALQSLAKRDVLECSTLISAANTGVLNLYARLDFQFNRALLGFRKFL